MATKILSNFLNILFSNTSTIVTSVFWTNILKCFQRRKSKMFNDLCGLGGQVCNPL